jgi:hypothetical protein
MTDISIIKENYARMADEQLIELVQKDAVALTYNAFIELKREFVRRQLNNELINAAEELRRETSRNKILNNFKREDYIITRVLWNLIIKEKAYGRSNEEIISLLIQKGVLSEDAADAVKKIELFARAGVIKLRKTIIISALLIFIGIAIFFFCFSGPFNVSYFLPACALILAPLRNFRANSRAYQQYEKALTTIENEKTNVTQYTSTGEPPVKSRHF